MIKLLVTVLISQICMALFSGMRLTPIESFDSGSVTLTSWADEDLNPDAWSLDTSTPDASPYCLKITGNTWKHQQINPCVIDSVGVIQLKVKTQSGGKIQGIGFSDGVHQLFYSFSGTAVLNLETWVPVYQGAVSAGAWSTYQLPLASDWLAFFEYLPVVTGIIYVNDMDGVSNRTLYFDAIEDISSNLPIAPRVRISANPPAYSKEVGINFQSNVYDPDSSTFTYEWAFGDSTTSAEPNPFHLYTAAASHAYTATLTVTDNSGKKGYASISVPIDQGPDNLPVTMNFVGDIMLARAYEANNGIIQTLGVNAIFTPTKPLFGDAAEINVANLEVVLSNTGTAHPTKTVKYRGNPANVSGLVYAGIDVVSTANNHTLDYGLAAMQQMQGLLDTNGILHSGAGEDAYHAYEPTFINRRGLNIAFLRSSDRTGQYNNAQPFLNAGFNKPGFAYMTPFYIDQQLAAIEDVADLKIVEMHGGSEYSLTPGSGYDKSSPYFLDDQDEEYNYRSDVPHQWDIDIRHSAIDSGADLVIVHHPHIIQGLEVYNNKLIAHSLGNFVFDLDYPETMPSMILYADADHEGFTNFKVKPIYIDGYIPKPATGQLGEYILDCLAMRSRDMNTRLWVDKSNMEAKVLMDGDNPPVCDSPCTITKMLDNHTNGYNLTQPINLPRSGSISEISSVEPGSDVQIRLGQEDVWYGNFENEGSSLWVPPAYSTTEFMDGTRSALLTVSGTSTVTSTIPNRSKWYNNTKKYTLHGWIKTENSGAANIIIRYYNNRTTGSVASTESIIANITGTTEWAFYSKEITIPTSVYYYDIRLSNTGSGSTSNAWFDNVGLIEWSAWSSANDLASIPWPNNYYWMQAQTLDTMKSVSISFKEQAYMDGTTAHRQDNIHPSLALDIYPNPFNPTTTISYYLPFASDASINIYNIKGQLVKNVVSSYLEAGNNRLIWDSTDKHNRKVASGLYLIKVEACGRSVIRKAVVLK